MLARSGGEKTFEACVLAVPARFASAGALAGDSLYRLRGFEPELSLRLNPSFTHLCCWPVSQRQPFLCVPFASCAPPLARIA